MNFDMNSLICLAPYIILLVFAVVIVLLPKPSRKLAYAMSMIGRCCFGTALGDRY